jgi:hypothetical protein
MIIDSLFGYGNIAIFADQQGAGNKLLTIEEITKQTSAGVDDSTPTYQYSGVSFRMRLKANAVIKAADALMLFQYPVVDVLGTLPTSYTFAAVGATPTTLQKIPNGTAVFSLYASQAHLVSGLTDELLPINREFNINTKGAVAGDGTPLSTATVSLTVFLQKY